MIAPTIVDSTPQVQAPRTWDKATAQARAGDYIRVPFAPVMSVVNRDVLETGQIWLLVKPVTGTYTEEWLLEPEPLVEKPQHSKQQPQPTGFAGDSVSCQLQPTQIDEARYKQGFAYGESDAHAKLYPGYDRVSCQYTAGYLAGYNSVFSPQPKAEVVKQAAEWKVTFNDRWQWYDVWVGDRCCREKAGSYKEAEQIAQRQIALDELIQRQNAIVLAAYAD